MVEAKKQEAIIRRPQSAHMHVNLMTLTSGFAAHLGAWAASCASAAPPAERMSNPTFFLNPIAAPDNIYVCVSHKLLSGVICTLVTGASLAFALVMSLQLQEFTRLQSWN